MNCVQCCSVCGSHFAEEELWERHLKLKANSDGSSGYIHTLPRKTVEGYCKGKKVRVCIR